MKNSVIYMAMAAVALASCSKDETSEVNLGTPIEFRTAVGTRAETASTPIQNCFMSAVDKDDKPVFSIQEFTDPDGDYTLTHAQGLQYYWPADGSDVTFYAFTPTAVRSSHNETPEATIGPHTISNFIPNYPYTSNNVTSNATQYDLMGAVATGNKNSNGVTLTFKHLLSNIEIQAMSANTSYKFEVIGWRLANVKIKGSFDLTNQEAGWTFGETPELYTYTYRLSQSESIELNDSYKVLHNFELTNTPWPIYMIPQQLTPWEPDKATTSQGAYMALLVRITSKTTGAVIYPTEAENAIQKAYDWVAVPLSTNWMVGKKYVYKLDFTNGAGNVAPDLDDPTQTPGGLRPGDQVLSNIKISFTVNEIDDWGNGDPNTGDSGITM